MVRFDRRSTVSELMKCGRGSAVSKYAGYVNVVAGQHRRFRGANFSKKGADLGSSIDPEKPWFYQEL
jgi:hypothetical protein